MIKVGFLFDYENPWIYEELRGLLWIQSLSCKYEYFEILSTHEATGLDILFILGYTKILPISLLQTNQLNLVIHESALPQGRGFSPVQWQIIEGVNKIPVSLIEASEEVDAGDIIGTAYIHLKGDELLPEIRAAQAEVTKLLILNFLANFPDVSRIPQHGEASYYRRRGREDDKLDLESSISSQFNKLRIVDNEKYPAYFEIHGSVYEIQIKKVCKDD